MVIPKPRVLPRGRIAQWSRERLEKLSTAELKQLKDNAAKLNEVDVVALCEQIIASRPRGK